MKKASILIWIAVLMIAAAGAFGQTDNFFGKNPPGTEPVKFLSETLHLGLCPHGQLVFASDGSGVFWSAIALEGRQQTIYWSAFDGKTFSPPVVAPFAAASGNGGPAFSPDGRRLFFCVEISGLDASSPKTMAIAYVERAGSGWTKPVTIESTADTQIYKGQVSVARSGNLYFVGRILTERTLAIFISRFADGRYSPPEKLAGAIASLPLVSDPWVDPDERFLLVSCPPAEGPPMLTDIGICSRLSDGTWSKPVRLSGPVNTSGFERFASLSSDGKYLFFIRAFGEQFVSDQARFFWVETKDIPELQAKAAALSGPYLGQKPPGMTPEVFAPGIVSTEGAREFSGAFSPDGMEYYFFRFGTAPDLMVSRLAGNVWTEPRPAEFDSEFIDNEPHITGDGKTFFFCSNRPFPGSGEGRRMTQVWMMRREGASWGTPRHLLEGMAPSSSSSGNIFIGSRIYQLNAEDRLVEIGRLRPDPSVAEAEWLPHQHTWMSSDESFHLFDFKEKLYVSFRTKDGNWGKPVDLGARLNLEGGIMLPTLSPDGRYLFFCHLGDIYWVDARILESVRDAGRNTIPA